MTAIAKLEKSAAEGLTLTKHPYRLSAMRSSRAQRIALVANMSGGKDSVFMLEQLVKRYPGYLIIAVYADTGWACRFSWCATRTKPTCRW